MGIAGNAALGTAHLWQQIHKCLLSGHRCLLPQLSTESQEVLIRKLKNIKYVQLKAASPRGVTILTLGASTCELSVEVSRNNPLAHSDIFVSSKLSGVGSLKRINFQSLPRSCNIKMIKTERPDSCYDATVLGYRVLQLIWCKIPSHFSFWICHAGGIQLRRRTEKKAVLCFLMYKLLHLFSFDKSSPESWRIQDLKCKHVAQTVISEIPLLQNKVCLASILILATWAIISSPDAVQFERVWLKRLKK